MAYIDKDTVANIRKTLKTQFPNCKFSVRKRGNIALSVAVMKSPYFEDGVNRQVNQYWIDFHYEDQDDKRNFLNAVNNIIKSAGDWYDNSDSMTDYFDTAFYYDIEVGQFDKPHTQVTA